MKVATPLGGEIEHNSLKQRFPWFILENKKKANNTRN